MGQAGRATKKNERPGTAGAKQFRGITQQGTAEMNGKKSSKKLRGVFEKVLGSDIWWIQYFDADGCRRREKAGRRGDAIDLLAKRKAEKLQGIKLPEKIRARRVQFSELIEDCEVYVKEHNTASKYDVYRLGRLKEQFGNRPAEVPIEDLRKWMGEQTWKAATANRYKSLLSLLYRLGIENKKVKENPAKLLKHKREDNGRIRFLNQFKPADTKLDYLKKCKDEESRLRAVILRHHDAHMPEFEIALHTGMRPSEQFGLTWDRVDLVRNFITLLKTKTGKARHIPLNSVAVTAFKILQKRSPKGASRVFLNVHDEPLTEYKHWFEPAVTEAGIADFTWYCLRHTFASRLAMAGVDLRTIADLMGHQTIQMTMRYAHLAPAHQRSAVEQLVAVQKAAPRKSQAAKRPSKAGSGALKIPTATRTATTGTSVQGGSHAFIQ
jgi:site-specific recombinase XerD